MSTRRWRSRLCEEFELDLRKCKRLTEDEQREKIYEYWVTGNLEARNQVAESNLRLAVWVAMKYRDRGDLDDLIQAASFALLRAIDQHEPSRGKLSTYIVVCVRRGILRFLRPRAIDKRTVSYSSFEDGGESICQTGEPDGVCNTVARNEELAIATTVADRLRDEAKADEGRWRHWRLPECRKVLKEKREAVC